MEIKTSIRRLLFGGGCALFAGVVHTLLSALSLQPEPRLMLDESNNHAILPRNFRTTRDPLPEQQINLEGLRSLNIAGSGQFSARELKEAVAKLESRKSIWLIDLRQECHGFLNGNAISWYAKHNAANFGKSLDAIVKEETSKIQAISKEKEVLLHTAKPHSHKKDEPQEVEVLSCITEQQLAQSLGLHYVRLPVTDHLTPDPATVDRYLTLLKSVPEETWLYFHCRGGDGRTGTFMVMYDMLHNAKKISFEEIVMRQWHLGGNNLAEIPEKCNWRAFRKEERFLFLHQFYDFCRQKEPNSTQSFSDWLKLIK